MVATLRHIISSPRRRWRAKGHGIHSPFAYQLVTQTLARHESYYIYEQIDALDISRHRRQFMKLVVRLLSRFNPARVIITASDSRLSEIVVNCLPETSTVVTDSPDNTHTPIPDMVIIPCSTETIDYRLAGDNVIVIEDIKQSPGRDAWQLLGGIGHAMRFTDTRIGIIILSHSLPSQTFTINI